MLKSIKQKGLLIKQKLKQFYMQHQNMDFESLLDFFSFFGGIDNIPKINSLPFEYIKETFIPDIQQFEQKIAPTYLLESPYKELLIAVAKGDGKLFGAVKKARLSETIGEDLADQLNKLEIIYIEKSREICFGASPKLHKNYRIQSKIRFKIPFYRFWFGFIEPFRDDICKNNYNKMLEYLEAHYERLRSLLYEQLSNEMLIDYFNSIKKPIISSSSYWDRNSEFDIVAYTETGEIIVAECKYKDRKVCKNELGKLKFKAEQSGLKPTYYALFSKDGFSKELLQTKEPNLLIFDINDMKRWLLD